MGPTKYLPLFIAGVLGMGLLIGFFFPAGAWHAALEKPPFNPPNWLFGPVWSILYVLIGIVGWRVWCKPGLSDLKPLWIIQMILNFLWSPAFFGAQNPWLGLLVIVSLLASIVIFIQRSRILDPISAALFVPYVLWVAFATLLNGSIAILN